jgi:hypothetical protein
VDSPKTRKKKRKKEKGKKQRNKGKGKREKEKGKGKRKKKKGKRKKGKGKRKKEKKGKRKKEKKEKGDDLPNLSTGRCVHPQNLQNRIFPARTLRLAFRSSRSSLSFTSSLTYNEKKKNYTSPSLLSPERR